MTRECSRRTQSGPAAEADALVNLAFGALQRQELPRAGSWLAAARHLVPRPAVRNELWQLELEGRLALREGRLAQALERYRLLARLAEQTVAPEGRWRAAVGQALALDAQGRGAEALRAYQAAEELLDRQLLSIPLAEGRGSFLGERELATRWHLDLLLRRGSPAQALAVARHARVRQFVAWQQRARIGELDAAAQQRWDAGLAQVRQLRTEIEQVAAQDWTKSAAQRDAELPTRQLRQEALRAALDRAVAELNPTRLPAPAVRSPPVAPGTVLLLLHPLPRGWAVFAADPAGVVAWRLPDLTDATPTELSRQLLAPAVDRWSAATQLRVLAQGAARALDIHALPWEGRPLQARLPVVYALDLPAWPPVPSAPPTDFEPDASQQTLVVADPRGDLAAARQEGAQVAQLLTRGGGRVLLLHGAAASGAAVREGLTRSAALHFAGHAVTTGGGGWESSLLLADRDELTVSDILALGRVPRVIMLSACESAGIPPDDPGVGMGVAQAFLLSGAKTVVAAVRPVRDRLAAALAETWYGQGAGTPELGRLQQALLALHEQQAGEDWAAFRVLVR